MFKFSYVSNVSIESRFLMIFLNFAHPKKALLSLHHIK